MALLPDTNTRSIGGGLATAAAQPNLTYRMQIEEERIQGALSERLAAVEQAAYKILNTERYAHVIYSWNYGVELADLFGKPIPYVLSEIPRRIREALVQDDRINAVTDFDISYVRDNAQGRRGDVLARFKVRSIYGDIAMEKGVTI